MFDFPQNVQNVQQKEYEVQMILDRRINPDDSYFYHVKWVGYSQTTWEPLSNLLGAEAVQKMIADFQKSLQKKNKKNWSKGLVGWANLSKNSKNDQNINKNNLDQTFYKPNDPEVVDLQKASIHNVVKKIQNDENPSNANKLKKKTTSKKNDQYPFQRARDNHKLPYFMRKVSEIKQIDKVDGISKCLVKWKGSQTSQEWIQTDLVRLIAPQMLLVSYQKYSQKNIVING